MCIVLNRTTLSTSEKNGSDENTDPCYQLWSSVCSTFCACVNNPQNGMCCSENCERTSKIFSKLVTPCFHFYSSAEVSFLCLLIWGNLFLLFWKIKNICCSVFPYAKEWLKSCTEPEIVCPICSFLGLTVANNCKCS